MRCFKCKSFTIFVFCKTCQEALLNPNVRIRELGGFKIYTFYDYSDIKELLNSKHKIYGSYIFKELAGLSFRHFALSVDLDKNISIVPINDTNTDGYSHTAILANSLKTERIKPIFNALHATNNVTYSGKDLEFRRKNPRKFKLLKRIEDPVILVDDIITTGSTLLEAKDVLNKNGVDVLCGITLADARF